MTDKPPAVPTKLVHQAVRTSDLPSDSRHIMHVLGLIADYQTSELPPRFTPSTKQLARETGLSDSTVIRRRKELEKAGWIVLKRPTASEAARHVPIRYFLAIPATGAHRDHAKAAARLVQGIADANGITEDPTAEAAETPGGFTVHPPEESLWTPAGVSDSHPETESGGSHSHPGGVSQGHPEPPSGVAGRHPAGWQPDTPKNTYQEHYQEPEKPPAGAGGRQERLAIAEELTQGFWRTHGEHSAQRLPAVRSVIITAVADNGMDRDDAARALHRLAAAGQQITPASLTAAVARLRGHDPARADPPPPAPRPPVRYCAVPAHSRMQLTDDGICNSCAGDALARPDDPDEQLPIPAHLARHLPGPRHHAPGDTQTIPKVPT